MNYKYNIITQKRLTMPSEIFTEKVISYLRQNKQEITQDLLDELRSYGNTGKQIALDILDLDKDNEQYYLDAYGNRISFNGNRRLKKAFTKLNLYPIHVSEIQRCANDIRYFKDNYVKIKTKTGVNFPDLRPYQNEFFNSITPEDHEDNVVLMSRQSGKSVTTAIYLSHKFNFSKDLNIGIVANKGAQAREFLSNTKNILVELPVWIQQGVDVWNKGSIENESNMRILTDVPSSDSFRGYTIAILIVDECSFIRTSIWEEFSDSIFPSQSALAWKKNIILSTANGMNHFYKMVKGAREKTNGMNLYEVNWKDVPRFNADGSQMDPEEFKEKIIKKHGVIYFNQNYANHFLGSSHTLISSEKLTDMKYKEVQKIKDNKLKIYLEPEHNHKYIMTVDPAKDGTDAFAVQIVDISDYRFIQTATAELQIDYLLMPEFLYEWAVLYNNAYLIIENNEGAGQSIADQLYRNFEYSNIHFDKHQNSKKKYPGFRTTSKTRKQILQTLKLFIENDKLQINDKNTINELYQFILINGKFQADDGSHDDMVMSLALVFVPFCDTKNFEDIRKVTEHLYRTEEINKDDVSFGDLLNIGEFDSAIDEDIEIYSKKEFETLEEALENYAGFN